MRPHATCQNSRNPFDREELLSLKSAVYEIKSYFGSSYLCKSLFSKEQITTYVMPILAIFYEHEYHPTFPALKN
jgi:hypothetical protein